MTSERYAELKRMLEDRKREIMSEVHEKIRDVRTESGKGKMSEVFDEGESSEADIQEDIEFALIQMKAETLSRINEALVAAGRRGVRRLLRVRRGDRPAAAAGPAVCGPVQGLRAGARERDPSREADVPAVLVALL